MQNRVREVALGEVASAARTQLRAQGVKPRLRGILDVAGTVLAVPAAAFIIAYANPANGTMPATVYGLGLVLLFGVSATYHTPMWSHAVRRWLRRADHAMIFVFIAACYTPVALLALPANEGAPLLWFIWPAALLGVLKVLFWPNAPRVLNTVVYVGMSWALTPYFGVLFESLGTANFALFLGGGVLYTTGAAIYAKRWPNPHPSVFGYHEIFHVFVVVAAAAHYVAMWNILTA